VNPPPAIASNSYRGRLAPSPTGYLHLGHARTFWLAQERARAQGGTLILRNDDLDSTRYQMGFVAAMLEDLRWFGFEWGEGPDIGGGCEPYNQSERMPTYRAVLEQLCAGGFIYPCTCSRKDILAATRAPHANDDGEPLYPGTCRDKMAAELNRQVTHLQRAVGVGQGAGSENQKFHWRFRVPDGETVAFMDGHLGSQKFIAGKDFGDFVVWRGDDVPAYQLACVADDAAMRITEVVRGADLLVSTARQILLYRALGLPVPDFFHCDLMRDKAGVRLAKRHDVLSLRALRASGLKPEEVRQQMFS